MTYTVGKAVQRAAEAAREKLLQAASEELEIGPGDLEVVDGVVEAVGAPDRSISVEDIAKKALRFGGRHEPVEGHGGSAQTSLTLRVGAHRTRQSRPRDGRGGAARLRDRPGRRRHSTPRSSRARCGRRGAAIGWALYEELVHDEEGQLLSGSFLDYAIPTADRVPPIDTVIVEVPAPDGPFGAKGIGRARSCPDRRRSRMQSTPTGVRLRELPMTPPRIWAALNDGQ